MIGSEDTTTLDISATLLVLTVEELVGATFDDVGIVGVVAIFDDVSITVVDVGVTGTTVGVSGMMERQGSNAVAVFSDSRTDVILPVHSIAK